MNSDENPPPAVEQETVRENPLEEFVEKETLEEATAAGQAQRDLNPTKTEESLAHFLADVFSRRVRKRPVEWRGSLDVTWTNRQGWYFVARAALLRLNPLNVPSVEPQLSKSDSVSGSSQTIVEPSNGNALNLQMALPRWEECEAACDAKTETPLQRFIYDNEPSGYEECVSFRKQLRAVLSSHAPEGEET